MPEPREARSIIESAEQAAAAGNYSAAEALLGEAAALQEQTLGPEHPDLANTLNNLGIVCEITDNPIDAEHYFRRAYAIATATLAPDHPFVATSRKNLHDFCAARGRPTELPPSPPQVAVWLEASAPRAATPRDIPPPAAAEKPTPTPIPPPRPTPAPRTTSRRALALGAAGAVAVLAVLFVMTRPSGDIDETEPAPAAETTAAPDSPAAAATAPAPAPPVVPPAEPAAPPAEPAVLPQPAPATIEPARSEASASGERPDAPTASATPTVVTAQLCTALRAWQCEAAQGELPSGPVSFYTQIKSTTATTVEHRWYQGDRLARTTQLRIQANPGAGYRTYSRSTVSADRSSEWRVELRSADGTILHEERFTVRPRE